MMATIALSDLVPEHPYPFYNLGVEPWIPVETLNGPEKLGFIELLRRCHEVLDLRVGDPLERFALLRYLISLTYLIYAYDPDGNWIDVLEGKPLPQTGVEAVVERMYNRWWLFHPSTPFAQIPELRTTMSKTFTEKDNITSATEGFECLVAFRPSKNNEIWWYKPDNHGMTYSEAALVLLGRHYAAVPGNEAGVLGESKSRCEGGLMVSGPQEVTNLVVGFPSFARLLAGNLISSLVDQITVESTLFFEAPMAVAEHLDDPLYRYSASSAAAFLVWPGEGNAISRVLRAPLPIPVATTKSLMVNARLADPHVLRVRAAIGSSDADNPNKGLVSFSATGTQFENVFNLYKRAADGNSSLRTCVLQPRERLFPSKTSTTSLVGVTITGGGTFTGTRIEAVSPIALDPNPLLLEADPAHALCFLINRLVDSKNSCLSYLNFSISRVIAGENSRPSDVKRSAISRQAQTLLWSTLDDSVARLYQTIATSPDGPWPTELPEQTKAEWIDNTVLIFDQLVGPYAYSPRTRARVAKYRHQLRSSLWKKI